MSTLRLAWGMFIRGAGWTAPIGALLGALYSMLVVGSLFFLTQYNGGGTAQSASLAALVSMEIVLGLGGGLVGGLIGIVFGPVGGLLYGLMTRFLFNSLPDAHRYERTSGRAGAIYGAAATVLGLYIISGYIPPPTGAAGNVFLFYVLPGLVGSGAGYYISQQIAHWFENDLHAEPNGSLPTPSPVAS